MASYGKKASDKVEMTMHEMKEGALKSGSGQKVTNPKQAIAIGLAEAREEGGKVPAKKAGASKTAAKKSPAKKTAARKSTARKTPVKKAAAKKSAARKAPAKKSSARKTTAKKAPAKKSGARETSR
ncbi:MAG: DUF6496 domain-containing protein [Pseudomonadota bacterium]|nr:DUF6496 domain-containing protein [Pseudomonadota bacterium]